MMAPLSHQQKSSRATMTSQTLIRGSVRRIFFVYSAVCVACLAITISILRRENGETISSKKHGNAYFVAYFGGK